MKKLVLCLMVIFPAILSAQEIKSVQIHSEILNQQREILVYLPWQYKTEPNRKFETIYVFDAQARQYFDFVHSSMNFINDQFPMIVVGVKSPQRGFDFLPKNNHQQTFENRRGMLGKADQFMYFIKDELIPHMNSNYRVLSERIAIGHSNGGTFISYCLMENPSMFNAYINVSPNFAYDKSQFVKRFKKFNLDILDSQKYYYLCKANESGAGWKSSNKKVKALFESKIYSKKFHFEFDDFSNTDDHSSVFTFGTLQGLKKYIDYQFLTSNKLIQYYDRLESNKELKLGSEEINSLAYALFRKEKANDAIQVIEWGIRKYPLSHNLYDSKGEFQEFMGYRGRAMASYQKAIDVLMEQKSTLPMAFYEQRLRLYRESINRISIEKK